MINTDFTYLEVLKSVFFGQSIKINLQTFFLFLLQKMNKEKIEFMSVIDNFKRLANTIEFRCKNLLTNVKKNI